MEVCLWVWQVNMLRHLLFRIHERIRRKRMVFRDSKRRKRFWKIKRTFELSLIVFIRRSRTIPIPWLEYPNRIIIRISALLARGKLKVEIMLFRNETSQTSR